jgi:hypothetical protein
MHDKHQDLTATTRISNECIHIVTANNVRITNNAASDGNILNIDLIILQTNKVETLPRALLTVTTLTINRHER